MAMTIRCYSQDLVDLLSDPSDGVERRGRFLRDISDPASSQRRQLTLGHSQDLLSVEENLALCDVQAAPGVAEQGEGDRRLSRARFADQAEHFAECLVGAFVATFIEPPWRLLCARKPARLGDPRQWPPVRRRLRTGSCRSRAGR